MKHIFTKSALAIFLMLGFNPLYGHGDHYEPRSTTKITEAAARQTAVRMMNTYVLDGKLDKSWKDVPVKSVREQTYQGTPEWVFTFNNPNEPKADQKNLYIFVNQYGEMTGANFSGQ